MGLMEMPTDWFCNVVDADNSTSLTTYNFFKFIYTANNYFKGLTSCKIIK